MLGCPCWGCLSPGLQSWTQHQHCRWPFCHALQLLQLQQTALCLRQQGVKLLLLLLLEVVVVLAPLQAVASAAAAVLPAWRSAVPAEHSPQ